MAIHYEHGNLVTPWLVRRGIDHALANGWDPDEPGPQLTYSIAAQLDDRRIEPASPAPAAIAATEAELLARLAEHGDVASRSVYADWLLERGDPRGELIVLATAESLEPEDKKRLAELEAERDRWLGPIVDVTRLRWWQHGMFDSCELGKSTVGAVDRALGHPGWSTVRAIDARGHFMSSADVVRVITQPVLHSLRTLSLDSTVATRLDADEDHGLLAVLAEHAVIQYGARWLGVDVLARLLARCPALVQAAVCLQGSEDVAALLATAAVPTLVIRDPEFRIFRTGADYAGASEVEQLTFAWTLYGLRPSGPAVRLRRGRDHRFSVLTLAWDSVDTEYARARVAAAIRSLPVTALTEVTIEPGGALDDREYLGEIHDALRRQECYGDFGW